LKVTVLTSTRADYSIYLPLLKALDKDDYFNLSLVVFGTHPLEKYGKTLDIIVRDGFTISDVCYNDLEDDNPVSISKNMGITVQSFANIWEEKSDCDLIICLGDRYEMFAAVSAAIPFNIPIAHFYGGETTLGAIDEVFRHSLTAMATYHFTSAEIHSKRVAEMKGSSNHIYNIGLMSIQNLNQIELYSITEFNEKWNVDFSLPTLLFTFHPETKNSENNAAYAGVIKIALEKLCVRFHILVTMPNADTANMVLRETCEILAGKYDCINAVESLGMKGYFSAMKYCKILLGNTSSGISEAASFNKYVVNLGARQEGRVRSSNVIDCGIEPQAIIQTVDETVAKGDFLGENIFYNATGVETVIEVLKKLK
jgi:GDP/UDP-N,N'-diacetylbacillosamine 2-epimerase (hydrolysing)